jgi:hypothetical protein
MQDFKDTLIKDIAIPLGVSVAAGVGAALILDALAKRKASRKPKPKVTDCLPEFADSSCKDDDHQE